MSAIEEHKPVEKRRALGRGLDSLLPSGPRVVTAAPPAASPMPGPVAIPSIAPPQPTPVPGEIAEINAGREKSPPNGPSASLGISAAGSKPAERLNLDGAPIAATTRTEMSGPHEDVVQQIPLDLIDEKPYQKRRTVDEAALKELAESINAS